MTRQNLTRAHEQLFRRDPDECATDLQALWDHCRRQKEEGRDRWQLPQTIRPFARDGQILLELGDDGASLLNDWSFSQLCRIAGVSKDTINRLSPETAATALAETLPRGNRPTQVLTEGDSVRSVHGTHYTRLWNADLLAVVAEFAVDFQPPPRAYSGGTGLYAGEQDMFAFQIDPAGWAEVEGEAFAPGFFVWNSEVGRRALGVSTFWFQHCCRNHIVWDAVEVTEFTAKHTSRIGDALGEVRRIIEALVRRRDERRDGFVRVVAKAMKERLGEDADEVLDRLQTFGVPRGLGSKAVELAHGQGFTIFSVVDALTRLAQEIPYAGERTEADQRAARLLDLVSARGEATQTAALAV
ncbi:DUF932 domain-containing protein [Tautonia sociabilis]|uniref:DUF932 domain-containing protein n=1 Tax=Tautonia sociabilis TaxID=2080755 RepID=A0A432MIH4_9BACT|nr:DUF932 domain-containing protein [Tautonia sociabilis]RUL86998.1 DUF932 domain-containing protein [Tautonia sociabilis]